MTVLSGFIAGSADGGAVNPAIAGALSAYSIDYWPPHTSAAAAGLSGLAVSAAPVVPGNVQALAGWKAGAYSDDWYDRIHVTPRTIALGNLLTTQSRTIEVWNAWRDQAKSLTAVAEDNAGGIDVTAPGAFPMDFEPLKSRLWQLNISTDGSPTISATLTWQFTGEDPLAVDITGNRVTAWTVTMDWSKGLTETLNWLTDVQEAVDGSVQGVVLRETPRRTWEFDAIAAGGPAMGGAPRFFRELMESSLGAWRARIWALPIWPDQTVLSAAVPAGTITLNIDTTDHDYQVGGLVILHADPGTYEVLEVDSLTDASVTFTHATTIDFNAGDRIWPCRLARLTDTPRLTRRSSNVLRTTLRFRAEEDCDWPAMQPATVYQGFPVLETRPDESSDPTVSPDRQLDELDGDVGAIDVNDVTGLPWWTQSFAWWLDGRAARGAHRSELYWMQGRAQVLWVPSFADDITLTAPLAAAGQVMTVASGGYSRFAQGLPGRQHIRIERNDGTVEYRGILAMAEVDADTEQLSIDSALASALDPADVRQISFMMLAALSSDEVEIDHITDSEGLARCAVKFTARPAEEPVP